MDNDTRNRELALLCDVRMKPSPVETEVLASFGDEEEVAVTAAIAWAWRERRVKRMSQRRAAELLGLTNSHLSGVLSGDKYLPPQKINQFEWVCGSTAVSQTLARFREARERAMVNELALLLAEQIRRVA